MLTKSKHSGYIIYRGASLLDGKPIVVVAITKSSNKKTGNMVQTYILPDNGMSPVFNAQNLLDVSVCGDCKHRRGLGGSCYVNLGQGPRAVADGIVRGIYPENFTQAQLGCQGRMVRLGTYGDPMAVPAWVWLNLLLLAVGHTGYSHQWNNPAIDPEQHAAIMTLCMASADSPEDYTRAQSMRLRSFRVRTAEQPALQGEFECPASEEQGKRKTCAECMACNGTRDTGAKLRASPTIIVHGSLKKRFIPIAIAA
jgi:hypothetical protein